MLNKEKFEILENEFNFFINKDVSKKLKLWEEAFINYNSHTNLMSKGDVEVIFEKHVYDSLAILKWKNFISNNDILDVGTGGGFPSVILAICFPDKKIYANDSRIKKINFIKEIKEKLNLENIEIVYSRIEDVKPLNVDLIVSRAVGKMLDVWELSKKHLKNNGSFVIYKSKLFKDDIDVFGKKYPDKKIEIIPYNLPLKEYFERNLVVLN